MESIFLFKSVFAKEELDDELIYIYFDKIKAYMTALVKEKAQVKKIKEQYGFKQLSNKEKFEKLRKKTSRKIG